MKRVVNVVEVLALVAVAVFLIMLFANEPDTGGGETAGGPGADLYRANCASCHGSTGGGGIGPKLSDGAVVEAYPDVADEIDIVTEGQDGMPSFEARGLSPNEIQQVVEYTRSL